MPAIALPKLLAALLLLAALAAAGLLYFGPPLPPAAAQATTDYDADDDGLIDIRSLAQLNAIRWDSDGDGDPTPANAAAYLLAFPDRDTGAAGRMGCPSGNCAGYELMADLTFPAETSSPHNPWTPIEGLDTVFNGQGHTLTNLRVNFNGYAGLFGAVGGSGRVRNVGLINAHVTSTAATGRAAGALVGNLDSNAVVETSYVQGGRIVTTGGGGVGDTGWVGGLIGSTGRSTIRACWANVTVTATKSPRVRLGGLVGGTNGAVIDSYAYGPVVNTASGNSRGGLIGNGSADGSAENSYCNLAAGLQSGCMGGRSSFFTGNVTARTAAQLQAPTDYTGIYSGWNRDLDGDSQPDYPWHFGTASQYPTLNTPAQRQAIVPGSSDYDANDDGLIEISSIEQLNAMRYDLDGDGDPGQTTSQALAYALAFPNPSATSSEFMGCPSGNCTGYELTASLTFPSETSSPYNPWTPIGVTFSSPFTATFDGNGHTLTGIRSSAGYYVGLFGVLGSGGVIRNLGMINAGVTLNNTGGSAGAAVGLINSGASVHASYAQGGRTAVAVNAAIVGGLVGVNNGEIRASYAAVAVNTDGSRDNNDLGGLAGFSRGTIIASYAAGALSATGTGNHLGGLVGRSHTADSAVTDSYCDTEATRQSNCVGRQTGTVSAGTSTVTVAGKTTAQLQTPTGYTGIYVPWNLDLDDNGVPDYLWNFGGSSDYPTLNTPAQRIDAVPAPTDYDANNNNLIDVSNLDQLNALRYDLDGDGDPDATSTALVYNTVFPGRTATATGRMGCPAACAGYELTASLTFPTSAGPYNPWTPVGDDTTPFNTTLDGAGRTLTGMSVTGTMSRAGLFGTTGASSSIRDLGMINATVDAAGAAHSGVLAGQNAGRIIASYASGGTVQAAATAAQAGGLVGSDNAGVITASYSTATVNITTNAVVIAGGLVGGAYGSRITAAYAAGPVAGTEGATSNVGGLAGLAQGAATRISFSYCDATATTRSACVGQTTSVQASNLSAQAVVTDELQTPTGYTGPYLNWNLDLDGNGAPDYPWNFGGSGDYPALNTPAQRTAAIPAPTDYDVNNNNLIDISSIAQLNAIRWDLDGDGDPDAANANAYRTVFAGRATSTPGRMGCPAACAGYELAGNLTFPAATSSPYNPWPPIDGQFNATFDGRGHTLAELRIINDGDTAHLGLFRELGGSGYIRDVGLLDPAMTSTWNSADGLGNTGPLVGRVNTGGRIDTSYVAGGRIAVDGESPSVGGLVGSNRGAIRASYATAEITAATQDSNYVGGLVGWLDAGSITAAYAAGPVLGTPGASSAFAGLAGYASHGGTITDSYCDSQATTRTQANCVGDVGTGALAPGAIVAAATSTSILQTPTDYTGPYINWNLDLDDNASFDYPWNFGAANEYPTLNTPAQRLALIPPPVDYDANDNNLIDIDSIDKLNAIRWDLNGDGQPATSSRRDYNLAFPNRIAAAPGRMGCPATCAGYELTDDLTFADGANWTPIGSFQNYFAATLDGNGHTLTDLNVNMTISNPAGLFQALTSTAVIRDLGLINPTVRSTAPGLSAGALAGSALAGSTIQAVYVQGGTTTIAAATMRGGGLVGIAGGAISAGYSTAAIALEGTPANAYTGVLAGQLDGGSITASYAAGPNRASGGAGSHHGGFVGQVQNAAARIANSYCDSEVAVVADCIVSNGRGPGVNAAQTAAPAQTTAQLQTPTAYDGLYLNWNLDLDNDLNLDYPWNFGASNEYPKLYTPTQRAQQIPANKDYDENDNNLIDIRNLDELNAMRWDANGDGDPETANFNAYGTIFAGRTATATGRMGCPTGCQGYELRASLTFPTEGPYANWTGINNFATTFDGNGHTLTGLTVHSAVVQGGLFRHVRAGGHIKNLGIIEPNIRVTNPRTAGGLAGTLDGGRIDTSYVAGGRIAVTDLNARAGGLVGYNRQGSIRASYATATVTTEGAPRGVYIGGLVGWNLGGAITASYAAGPVSGHIHADNSYGGLVGDASRRQSTNAPVNITLSYCDSEISPQTTSTCIGYIGSNAGTTDVTAQTTQELQAPADYEGIYANWNLDLSLPADGVNDNPWQFARGSYPRLAHQTRAQTDSPPPGGPRQAQPPQDTPYNPAADHPEVYENPRYEMAATCDVKRNADGVPESSTITIDLGNYRGQVILHLAQWNGQYFTSYESLGIDMPTFERDGQTATVRVTTDPSQTRFLLDSISPTTNLVLGYADCHTDDDTGVLVTPGTAAAAETPAETPATSTPADAETPAETAETSTPPAPKIYTNDRYEMTASCDVRNDAEGQPESSLITFDLGRYEATVLLSISLWNGEYYASLESHSLPEPTLARDGQSATVLVTTNPAETRFLLDGTPNGLRTNLLLGYADCHTAGE